MAMKQESSGCVGSNRGDTVFETGINHSRDPLTNTLINRIAAMKEDNTGS